VTARGTRLARAVTPRLAWGLILVGFFVVVELLLAHRYGLANPTEYDVAQVAVLLAGGVAIALGGFFVRRTWRGPPTEADVVRAGRFWAPFAVAFVVYFVAFLTMSPLPVGDQQHFQLESISIAYDLDRDLANDYADRALWVFPRGAPDRHAAQYTPGGGVYSYHSVGLPLLLAPAVSSVQAMGEINPRLRLWPWQLTMIVIASLAALLLYRILRRLGLGSRPLRIAVWAFVVFSVQMVIFANETYTEIPAALLVLVAVHAVVGPPRRSAILLGACAVAYLPWLNARFFPIALLLCVALAARAITALPATARDRATSLRAAAPAVLPLLLSLVALSIMFQHWYGSPLLNAQYQYPGHPVNGNDEIYRAWASNLWGRENGWLPYSPIALLALASLGLLWRRFGRQALYGLLIAGSYVALVVAAGGNPGFAFPGRLFVVLIPLTAIPLLVLAESARWGRWAIFALGGASMLLTAAFVLQPPPAVTSTPGQLVGFTPQGLWQWYADLWPDVSRFARYPDVTAVLALTGGLIVLNVVIYLFAGRRAIADGRAAPG
jgi:hypothetical protein